MLKIIEKLRGQDVSERRKVAFFVALSVTGLVFFAWVMSLSVGSYHAYEKPVEDDTTPLAAARDAFTDATAAVKDAWNILRDPATQYAASSSATTTVIR